MKKLYSLMLAAALGGVAQTARAEVPPFYGTQLVGGMPADTTRWYTMNIGQEAYVIGAPTAGQFVLNSKQASLADDHLWCFVGDEATGYTIYYKAGGATKVLAAPDSLTASNAQSVYATLVDANATAGYTTLWKVTTSTLRRSNYAPKAVSLAPANKSGIVLSRRNGKLAFTSTAVAETEAILVEFGRQRREVSMNTGKFTRSNPAKTWHAEWTATTTQPALRLANAGSRNNMRASGTNIEASSNLSNSYRIQTDANYVVAAYEFDFTANKAQTIQGGGKSVTGTANGTAHFSLANLEEMTASFQFSAPSRNELITLSNFYVNLERTLLPVEEQTNVFETRTGSAPYRIPAIEKTSDGRLLAFTDLRPGGQDIGMGLVHIKMRASDDNGKTWGEEQSIATGTNNRNDGYRYAYGDAAVVADRESQEVLVHVAAGAVSYWASSYSNPQRMAHFRSSDGGRTWDNGTEVTQKFYQLFENRKKGNMNSMFLTSGRIHQSRYVKKGDYYRLYAALATREEGNFCVYSDDFGHTWHILGDNIASPITEGDEVKCEELPDGSVLLSSRAQGKRLFNIFTFSNALEAEGNWGFFATSYSGNNGINPQGNSTNGEVVAVPVRRKADGKKLHLLVHTIPFGSGRSNVGFYYKEIGTYEQAGTTQNLVKNWVKGKQISRIGSAYSSLVLQSNDSIGVLFEEETFGAGYTIVYKSYSVEDITNKLYSFDGTNVEGLDSAYTQTAVQGRVAGLRAGHYVGQLKDLTALNAAKDAYLASPTPENAEAVTAAAFDAQNRVPLVDGKWYRLTCVLYPNKALTSDGRHLRSEDANRSSLEQLFQLKKGDGGWHIIQGNKQVMADTMYKDNQIIRVLPVESNQKTTTLYRIYSDERGETTLWSLATDKKKHPCIHRGANGNIVGWHDSEGGTRWFLEPVDSFVVTLTASPDDELFYRTYSLPFGFTTEAKGAAYKITSYKENKAVVDTVSSVPEKEGVLLKGTSANLTLYLNNNTTPLTGNLLVGTLKATTVEGALTFVSGTGTAPQFTQNSTAVQGNTAYLQNAPGQTHLIDFSGVINGLLELTPEFEGKKAEFYDLTGRRLAKPIKGITIQNGKKVLF